MNPLTNMKNVTKLSEQELYTKNKTSWHDQYKNSAWIFVGGFPYDLTEGDIICIFSQYGEIVNINLIRDKDTGKSKGFCFLCYEDQRSTVLAVDNFNGIKVLNRILRVDHVNDYKIPKSGKKTDEETKKLYEEGCAPKAVTATPIAVNPLLKINTIHDVRETLADQIQADIKLPARLPIYTVKTEPVDEVRVKIEDEKTKKPKKKKKSKKYSSAESSTDSEEEKKQKRRKYYSTENSESDSEKHKKRKCETVKRGHSSKQKYSDNTKTRERRSRSSDKRRSDEKYSDRSESGSIDRKHHSKTYESPKNYKKKRF